MLVHSLRCLYQDSPSRWPYSVLLLQVQLVAVAPCRPGWRTLSNIAWRGARLKRGIFSDHWCPCLSRTYCMKKHTLAFVWQRQRMYAPQPCLLLWLYWTSTQASVVDDDNSASCQHPSLLAVRVDPFWSFQKCLCRGWLCIQTSGILCREHLPCARDPWPRHGSAPCHSESRSPYPHTTQQA